LIRRAASLAKAKKLSGFLSALHPRP